MKPPGAPRLENEMTKSVFSPSYDLFRHLLIETRNRLGLTQAGLAEKLGKPQSYVSKYERGERRLDVIEFLDIASALEVDALALLRRLQSDLERGDAGVRREET